MAVHDFNECLERSHEYADAPWWGEIYRQAFVGFIDMLSVRDDCEAQRRGIDRLVYLKNDVVVRIDEKVRDDDYGDIILEYLSDEARGTLGWVAKDGACDYIAYAIAPSRTCYLLPFRQLRAAWQKNGDLWIKNYGSKRAENKGYNTVFVPVPVNQLFGALANAMRFSWKPSPDASPSPEAI
jgi:hypothetical protein